MCVNPLMEAEDLLAWFHINFLTLISFLCLPVEIFLWISIFLISLFLLFTISVHRLAWFWNHASNPFLWVATKQRSFLFTYLGFCWRKKEKSLVYLGSRYISYVQFTHRVLIFLLFYTYEWTLVHACMIFIQFDYNCRKFDIFSVNRLCMSFLPISLRFSRPNLL